MLLRKNGRATNSDNHIPLCERPESIDIIPLKLLRASMCSATFKNDLDSSLPFSRMHDIEETSREEIDNTLSHSNHTITTHINEVLDGANSPLLS